LPIRFSDEVRSLGLDLLAFFFFFVIALPLESSVFVLYSTASLITRRSPDRHHRLVGNSCATTICELTHPFDD
jgi:hypothetical protein